MTPEEEKEIKKEFAKAKRKVVELAGVMHDIVEDTIWTEYKELAKLSAQIEEGMELVNELKSKYDFL